MFKIRWRITISIIISTLLVVALMGFSLYKISMELLDNRGMLLIDQVIEKSSDDLNRQILSVIGNKNALDKIVNDTYDPTLAKMDSDYNAKYLERIKPTVKLIADINIGKSAYVYLVDPKEKKVIDGIWYADLNKDGMTDLQENLTQKDLDILYRPSRMINAIEQKQSVWTSPFPEVLGIKRNATYVSYTGPVVMDQAVVAVVGADMYYDKLLSDVKNIQFSHSGEAFLIDRSGRFLYHSSFDLGSTLKTVERNAYKELAQEMMINTNGTKTVRGENDEVYSYLNLYNDWVLCIKIDKSEFYEGINKFIGTIIIIAIGAVFIAIALGIYFGRVLGRPFEYLTKKINIISEGNYSVEIDDSYIQRLDEVGILSKSIELMRKRQRESFEEINRNNLKLENTVKERTEQLIQTNEYLEESLAQVEEQQAQLIESNSQLEESMEKTMRAQKKLIETEKIASLGYLVAGVAHEINTPVGNCITMSTFMENEVKDIMAKFESGTMKRSELKQFFDESVESFDGIVRNLEMSRNLLDNFKALAVNKVAFDLEEIELVSFIKEAANEINHLFSEIECDIEVKGESPIFLKCESQKLFQIISEMVENSFVHGFAHRTGNRIDIEVMTIEAEGFVKVIYKDNGKGIKLDQEHDIFAPFFTTKLSGSHSGLGLNLVYNLVKSTFDGDIIVWNDHQSSGLTFEMKLSQKEPFQ